MTKPYKDKKHHHRHKCDRCNTVWEHHDNNAFAPTQAHKCPNCETTQAWIHHGPETPSHYKGILPGPKKTIVYL